MALTTLPGDFETTAFAQEIVGSGLAACVSVLPEIRSVYTWQGVPQVEEEQQIIMKTTTDRVDALWEFLKSRHPFEVPEFLVIPVIDGSEDYLRWVEQSVALRKET